MTVDVLARVAALRTTPTPELKRLWRELVGTEPPTFNRSAIESRLAYRIQELAYGGLSESTVKRLDAMARQMYRADGAARPRSASDRPVTGTRLIREWRGAKHVVTVRLDDFEYQGRPYKSLSAVAKAITGSHWNGRLFFGLRRGGDGR